MRVEAGTLLLHYRLIVKIGQGGMGVVWKPIDTALDRPVAIKLLLDALAGDPERLARFEREAKTLASLNHPNIAAIYGLEEAGSGGSSDPPITALVMELVEGDDLSQRIRKGAIPLDEALPIAKQIAEALEAAHEQGIIHRDRKPANIKVRPDGTVKVLDVGLAKAVAPDGATAAADAMNSPTLTVRATQMGMILGTLCHRILRSAAEGSMSRNLERRSPISSKWIFFPIGRMAEYRLL